MKSVVFQFKIPGVLTIRITGSNEGRFGRYCTRIGKAESEYGARVDYSSNVSGKWTIAGGKETELLREVRDVPVMYESVYQVRCNFDEGANVSDAYVFHEMKSVADEFYFEDGLLDGRLDFVNAPGRFTFDIVYVTRGREERLRLVWWVVSEKIDVVHDAKTIKEVIEKENRGFVYAFLSQTKNRAGLSTARLSNEGEWLDIFRKFVEPYKAAVDYVIHSPHLRYQPKVQFERADRIKRWTPQLANRYNRLDGDQKERYLFRTEHVQPVLDTTANRFVLFTLQKIAARLDLLSEQCKKASEVADKYAEQLSRWSASLRQFARNPFFRKIGRFAGFRQENLVLLRKRGYAKIFETWVSLQHAIDITGGALDAGNRPIWKLYEFWCYLEIRNYLRDVQGFELDEAHSGLGSLEKIQDVFSEENADADEDGTQHEKGGNKCEHVFNDTAKGRTITLTYQQSYSNANGADDDGKKSAHIVEQIPDIVMTIRENGSGNEYTYLFDAKYQIMSLPSAAKPETDAAPYRTINEMHRYRDAILYRRQKASGDDKGKLTHEVIGAYVLYPGRPDKSFNYKRFIEEENIGAIPLLPGTDGTKILYEFLDYVLKHQDAQSHLGTAIPTRGTTVVVGEAVGAGEIAQAAVLSNAGVEKVLKTFRCPVIKAPGADHSLFKQIRITRPGQPDMILEVDRAVPVRAADNNDLTCFYLSSGQDYLIYGVKGAHVEAAGIEQSSRARREANIT